jgi:4-amino-4-deoxy-L-arabinose transferase-like glycosyltransferase
MRIARRIGFDAFGAFCAGAVLLTTQYFLKYAQHAMMDVILTLFFLLGVDGYLTGEEGRRRGFVELGLATGLGILMKSVLGVFPLLVVASHRIWLRRARALTDPGLWLAGAIALAVAAPWFVFQLVHHTDQFLDEHVRWLLWSRGLIEPGYGGFAHDLFGYPQRIASVYWPWLPFALGGIWLSGARAFDRSAERKTRSSASLILLWLSVVIGIMSLGHVKKLWYVMSVFPCLALLSSIAIGRLLRSPASQARAMAWTMGVLAVFAGVVALTPLGPARTRQPDLQAMTRIVRANVPAGQKVLNLDAPYWELANQFLFYSDHDLTEPLADPARLREGLRQGGWALIAGSRVAEVQGESAATISVVARSGDWALLTAAPAAPVIVPPFDDAR